MGAADKHSCMGIDEFDKIMMESLLKKLQRV